MRPLPAAISLAGTAIGGMAWAVRGRSSDVFAPSVWRGKQGRKAIALTFDDGPSPGTEDVLEILDLHHAKATFFQCGENVQRAPHLSRMVSEAGHEIGNHSHTHPNCALRSVDFIMSDFSRAQQVIADAAGKAPTLVRAPFGVRWFGFREMQQALRLTGVMWTVIARDWRLPAPEISQRVIGRATDGAIICLHDGRGLTPNPDISSTTGALRQIIPALLDCGYHFETVSQILI